MADSPNNFVSRGGIKLQAALDKFQIDVSGKTVLDVGSSTGGFVDCLLQNGAAKVYAVDTAYGELAWKLRNDPKVVVMERTNILHLEELPPVIANPEGVKQSQGLKSEAEPPSYGSETEPPSYGSETEPPSYGSETKSPASDSEIASSAAPPRNDVVQVDLITIDAGWTKLELVLPVVRKFLRPEGQIIALLKPHYETTNKRGNLVRGVVPVEMVKQIKEQTLEKIKDLGFKVEKEMESPILGGAGNIEFLLKIEP